MLTLEEQEVCILLEPLRDSAKIYSSNPFQIRKLDRFCSENPADWKCTDVSMVGGDVIGKSYECPKEFIVFRPKRKTLTEKQRAAAAERMRMLSTQKSVTQN